MHTKGILALGALALASSLTAPSYAQGASLPGVAQDAYVKASNAEKGDGFGFALDISGDTMVVGAMLEDSAATGIGGNQSDNSANGSGAAYVYVRTAGSWALQAYLKPSLTEAGDRFGRAVAIDGDTIVVGAPFEDSAASGVNGNQANNGKTKAGAAYVFERTGTTWSQTAYLKASNPDQGDWFGSALDVSGDTIVVGVKLEDSASTGVNSPGNDNSAQESGCAYVFVNGTQGWTQQAYIKASNTDDNDLFGSSVAIDGDQLLVGAPGEDSKATGINGDASDNLFNDAGAAYLYERSGTTWTQTAYIKASYAGFSDSFGYSVAISGARLAVTAYDEASDATGINGSQTNDKAPAAGAVYAFEKTLGSWSENAFIKSSNSSYIYRFGQALDLDGPNLLVGAYSIGAGRGVNGDHVGYQFSSGAAYLFSAASGAWVQEAFLKASNTGANDTFGNAVAISGNLALVAARWEGSQAVGVGGDQLDNSAYGSGAAYTFDTAATCGVFRYGDYVDANVADLYSVAPVKDGGLLNLELSDFLDNGAALLALSAAPSALPALGGTIYIDLTASLFGAGLVVPVAISGGTGMISFPIAPGTAGLSIFGQAGQPDPIQPSGLRLTNGLQITVCP